MNHSKNVSAYATASIQSQLWMHSYSRHACTTSNKSISSYRIADSKEFTTEETNKQHECSNTDNLITHSYQITRNINISVQIHLFIYCLHKSTQLYDHCYCQHHHYPSQKTIQPYFISTKELFFDLASTKLSFESGSCSSIQHLVSYLNCNTLPFMYLNRACLDLTNRSTNTRIKQWHCVLLILRLF